MKRLIISFIIINFITTAGYGQKYLTADIKSKADSILKIYIGDSVFNNYCTYDNHTYYEFLNVFGKSNWKRLNKNKKTKGKFVNVNMRWNLKIPFPSCPAFDTLEGNTSFYLDSLLRPTQKPYLSFIPDFYWNKENCNLISKEEALIIASKLNLKDGTKPLSSLITYDTKTKTFKWEISQTLWLKKDAYNNDYGEKETIHIDALTGQVTFHGNLSFSAIY